MQHQLNLIRAKQILFAGKAIVTFQSVSGKWFTFKIKRRKSEGPLKSKLFFVSVLTGQDNEAWGNYKYIGTVMDGNFRLTKGSKLPKDDQRVKAFQWTLLNLLRDTLNDRVKIFHEGRCCRCGRRLTTPESVKNGVGPECINYL